jgi:tyrosine-protein kinase Etk/Wzc
MKYMSTIDESTQPEELADSNESAKAGSVDVFDLAILFAGRRRLIAVTTAVFLALGIALCVVIRPTFTASAIILPPQQQQSSLNSMMGQLGSLSALGGASQLGLKSPAEMYIGFLKSRTIADEIIQRFQLKTVYRQKLMNDLRKTLAAHTEFESGKDGLIHIAFKDHDPNRASEIVNAYIDQLYKMNSTVAVTEAAQRRVFFDQQVTSERDALSIAEDDLRTLQQRTGLIQLSGQAQEVIRSVAELRAEIASKEVEVQSLRSFATEQNPDVARAEQELGAMRAQLKKLESDQRQSTPGDITVPAGRVAEDSLQYARKLREVKYHDTLLELLLRQREAARIDEAKSAPIVQVIDRAVPPDRKSGPSRLLLILVCGLIGFSLAIVWSLLSHAWLRIKQSPASAAKLAQLRRSLSSHSL